MDDKGSPPPYQQLPSPEAASVVYPIFGKVPVQVTCGNCGQAVITSVQPINGACSYLASLVVFLLCFPFFWVPLLIDACKDYHHICPSCGVTLGVYKNI